MQQLHASARRHMSGEPMYDPLRIQITQGKRKDLINYSSSHEHETAERQVSGFGETNLDEHISKFLVRIHQIISQPSTAVRLQLC